MCTTTNILIFDPVFAWVRKRWRACQQSAFIVFDDFSQRSDADLLLACQERERESSNTDTNANSLADPSSGMRRPLISRFAQQVARGALRPDAGQERAAGSLEELRQKILSHTVQVGEYQARQHQRTGCQTCRALRRRALRSRRS